MKRTKVNNVKTIYIDQLKSKELKNQYLKSYLKEIVKFSYPFSIDINLFLQNNHGFNYKDIEEFHLFFEKLDENIIYKVFKVFPNLFPNKLIFITDNKGLEINHASFTDIISIDHNTRSIELMCFNNIKKEISF